MKHKDKLILGMILTVAGVAILWVGIHDAAAKTGAFTQSKDVYPVAAAVTAKKAVFTVDTDADVKIIDRVVKAPETAVLESETETEEATTEAETETAPEVTEEVLETEAPGDYTDGVYRGDVYKVAGVEIAPEIGDFLYAELSKYGIADQWFDIALCQMFQESRFNPNAANVNGLDKGILQYRITYWDWSRGDIFDWRAQIRLYCEQTARRLASGCSIWETVSRHNTSDYGEYNQEYVDQVFQWVGEE